MYTGYPACISSAPFLRFLHLPLSSGDFERQNSIRSFMSRDKFHHELEIVSGVPSSIKFVTVISIRIPLYGRAFLFVTVYIRAGTWVNAARRGEYVNERGWHSLGQRGSSQPQDCVFGARQRIHEESSVHRAGGRVTIQRVEREISHRVPEEKERSPQRVRLVIYVLIAPPLLPPGRPPGKKAVGDDSEYLASRCVSQ